MSYPFQYIPTTNNPKDGLCNFLYAVLKNDMISHKNSYVTGRLDWCRGVSSRKLEGCNAAEYEKQLGKAGMTVIPRKVDDLYSWFIDMIVRAFDDLFRIEPTARPDLSSTMKEKAADYVLNIVKQIVSDRAQQASAAVTQDYAALGMAVTPPQALVIAEDRGAKLRLTEEELRDIILEVKGVVRQYENEQAQKGAKDLSALILDFLQQTNSMKQIQDYLHDFCIYPFAVLHAGQTRTAKIRKWKGDKLVEERMNLPAIRRVSPYDFFWTQDSTDTQNGMGVAERLAMRRFDLYQLRNQNGGGMKFDPDAIDSVLYDFETRRRDWLVDDERLHEEKMSWATVPNETVDVFRIFILVSGEHLKQYTRALNRDVDQYTQYQLEAYFCDGVILGHAVHDADIVRPYQKESYEPIPSEFCGNSLPEILMVINHAARKGFTMLTRNMAKSTNPTLFINREMVDYDTLDEDEVVLPDNQYDFMAAIGSTGKPFELLEFPNYMGQVLTFLEYLETRSDIETGIPRYSMGQAAGLPSALRSTASLTLMIDNALKTVKSRVFRIGTNVIAPSVKRMTDWVMDNWDDKSVKVDADVFVRGLEGVITRSLIVGRMQELLQYLAPFAQQGMISQETIQGVINRFLLESGAEPSTLSTYGTMTQQALQQSMPTNPTGLQSQGSNLLGQQAPAM